VSSNRLFLVIPGTVLAALLMESFCERAYREHRLDQSSQFFMAAARIRRAFNE
jgi:hypothetical protein